MKKYNRKRKILSRIIIGTMYLSFIAYLLGEVQSITNWSYTFHEMLYVPITLAIYILPILFILWLFYFVKSYGLFKASLSIKKITKNIIIIFTLVLISTFFMIEQSSVSTSGLYIVDQKFNNENSFYIELNDKTIECTWNEYNLIQRGERYLVTFNWNKHWPEKGELDYIEPVKGDPNDK